MAKKRFSELQIYHLLRENESGITIPALVKKYGICQASIYNWKNKYGEMIRSEIQSLKELKEENERLKKRVAELDRENNNLKRRIRKIRIGKNRELHIEKRVIHEICY